MRSMPVLILLIVVGFYWKLTLTAQYTWVSGGDVATLVLPWLQEQARDWHFGKVPLWDPYVWAGQPLIGQALPGVAYPLTVALLLMPLRDGLIQIKWLNCYFVAIHFMAALFCYWLCRDLKRSRAAALLAACVFSFAGFIGTADWPQMLNGAVWAPLILLFLLRAARGYRPAFSAALSGAFLGMACLSGHYQIPIYLTLMVAGLWLFFIFRHGKPDRRVAGLAAVCLLFVFLIAALQILPAYEFGSLAKSWDQPVLYKIPEELSIHGSALVGALIPGLQWAANPFIGVVALCFAFLGIVMAWQETGVRLFTTIALSGLLFSLGFNNVFHGILYSIVPFLDKARSPSVAIFICHLAVAVLVSFGVDSYGLMETVSPWRRRVIAAVAALGALIYALFLGVLLLRQLHFDADDRVTLTALFCVLLAALLYAWLKNNLTRRHAVTMLVMLVMIELGNNSGFAFPNIDSSGADQLVPKMRENKDVAEFLKRQKETFRVELAGDDIGGHFGDWYGIEVMNASPAVLTKNIQTLEWNSVTGRKLFGIRYTLGRKPTADGQRQVFEGSSGVKVYETTDTFPRVWTVHEVAEVINNDQVNWYINNPGFDLRRTAPMKIPLPKLAACDASGDKAELLRRSPDRVTISAAMSCDGIVVLSDTYYPGWHATVDGATTPIHEVYGGFRGVAVKHGTHTVDMRYRPASVYMGGLLSLGGFIALCVMASWDRTKRLRGSAAGFAASGVLWVSQRAITAAGGVFILGCSLWLARRELFLYFTSDDVMNLARAWDMSGWDLIKANILFFSDWYRPLGLLFYRIFLAFAGFNPLPFHVAVFVLMMANLYLLYCLAARLTGSRETALLASMISAFHWMMGELFAETALIYDILCVTFYFCALIYYIRIRQSGRGLKPIEIACFLCLYICALNAKEMAVTLPVILLAYEWIYGGVGRRFSWPALWSTRQTTNPDRLPHMLVVWISALATAIFIMGKMTGAATLTRVYQPHYSLDVFLDNWRNYLGRLLYAGSGVPLHWMLLLWLLLLAMAWGSRSKTLLFSWVFIMIAPTPVCFIEGRGLYVFYLPLAGWALYAATLVVLLRKRLSGSLRVNPGPAYRAAVGVSMFFVLALGLMRARDYALADTDPEDYGQQRLIHNYARQFVALHPNMPKGASILLLDDPFNANVWTPVSLLRLVYGDQMLDVRRTKMPLEDPDKEAAKSYDFVFSYKNGRVLDAPRDARSKFSIDNVPESRNNTV